MNHINLSILNIHVTVRHFRFIKGIYFYGIKRKYGYHSYEFRVEISIVPKWKIF